MPKPKIADRKPKQVDLEAGEHYWCSCGESKNQPYCDGSHAGTEFTPVAFSVDRPEQAHLCMCKYTSNPPYCDVTHSRLPEDAELAASSTEEQNGPLTARNTAEEPTVELIHALARDGLEKVGHHGPMAAMGVPRPTLPQWDDTSTSLAAVTSR